MPRSRGVAVESTVTASARKPSSATRTVARPSPQGLEREAAVAVRLGRRRRCGPGRDEDPGAGHRAPCLVYDPAGDGRRGVRPRGSQNQECGEYEELRGTGEAENHRDSFSACLAPMGKGPPGLQVSWLADRRAHPSLPIRLRGTFVVSLSAKQWRPAFPAWGWGSPLTVAAPRGIHTHFAWPPGSVSSGRV